LKFQTLLQFLANWAKNQVSYCQSLGIGHCRWYTLFKLQSFLKS